MSSRINKKRPIYVLDTNVLLYNPRAVYAFPDADVVIPDTVLGELDKIKTSRADRELRYRSREISRILFELSENGKLTDGIPFGRNSLIQVISFDPSKGKLEQFGSKNSDDRILSVVHQMKEESNGRSVTIVTNDLNMLLKAQTLNIKVEHPGEEFAYSGVKRAWFKVRAKRKPLMTIAASLVILVGLFMVQQNPSLLGLQASQGVPDGPPELVQQFQDYQNQVTALETQKAAYEAILKKSPRDFNSLVGVGNIYFDLGNLNQNPKDYKAATDYYERALAIKDQQSVRTDMAVAYYNLGINDKAIQELNKVISKDAKFYQAYFNLGVILLQSENDPVDARPYFVKSLELAPQNSSFAVNSRQFLAQIDAQLKNPSQSRVNAPATTQSTDNSKGK